ncbi:MarR family winged helix-turn-helix transcriptional regulator [Saccharopolyspora sp. MS10]|uniref:MarR family winged helix-turn-helix transcriptional regulator n=1 Tax=Saccharopolyspora sp. MS10 TaxID=3385973 RepID=UPI00399F2C04
MAGDPEGGSAVRAGRDVRVVLSRLRRRLREVAADEDLTSSQLSVLTRLSKEGGSSASALAVAEGVRPQSMASTLAALSQLGLLERRPDPGDGRRQLITLSAAGSRRAEDDRQARRAWLTRVLRERCTEDERQTIIEAMALLERIAEP